MLYIVTFVSVVIVTVVPGNVRGKLEDEAPAVLVKINPFISKSKKVIQFGKSDGRFKRNGQEKSSLFLEFPESFFEDPKMKKLYNSLVGGSPQIGEPEKTNIVFQIDPSAFGVTEASSRHPKRDIFGDTAAFHLTVNAPHPRMRQMPRGGEAFVPRRLTTVDWCRETTPSTLAETTAPLPSETVTESTCHPSKPVTPMLRVCGGIEPGTQKTTQKSNCKCQNDAEETKSEMTTADDFYTQCRSTDAVVSHYLQNQCWTTQQCKPKVTTYMPYAVDVFSTTYQPMNKPSCLPSTAMQPLRLQQRFRRQKTDVDTLKKFFILSNSPQKCPPFCPHDCAGKPSTTCSTTEPLCTCKTATTTCKTTTSCKTTKTTTCAYCTTPNACSCPTTKLCCPKVKRAYVDDPLRNVLQVFRNRNPRRFRRNPTRSRTRRRRMLLYRPKHGLRKVYFRPFETAAGLK